MALKNKGNAAPACAWQRFAVCIIVAQLALTLPAAAVQRLPIPGITGEDERTLIKSADYPWSAIWRINNTLGGFCTGTLIGPRRVLTAAHCLWNRRTATWLPPCALHFTEGHQRGKHLGHALVVAYELSGGEPMRQRGPPIDSTEDWAVLTLAQNLGTVAVPSAPLDPALMRTYQQQHAVFLQAGYSRDRPHILTLNRPCKLAGFARRGHLLVHDCDATFGDSGSPILLERNGTYHIVAILIGIDKRTGKGIAVSAAAFHDRLQNLKAPPPVTGDAKAC